MFERFTERARQVVILAEEEARKMKHHYIGGEHILLGLVGADYGLSARVFDEVGMTAGRTRSKLIEIVGEGTEETSGQIPFTPRSKKIIEYALREALTLHHNYIGTEHILLGLIRENEGVASQILQEFDVDPKSLRNKVNRMLSGSGISSDQHTGSDKEIPNEPVNNPRPSPVVSLDYGDRQCTVKGLGPKAIAGIVMDSFDSLTSVNILIEWES